MQRGLFRRLSTGEPLAPWVTRFGYPFRWTYNVLNAAEYFRRASLLDGVAPDPRMTDAIELSVPPDSPTVHGFRPADIPDACGSTSMCPSESHRSG